MNDPESLMLLHFSQAKGLKENFVEESDPIRRGKIFDSIYYHEKKAEEFRRLILKLLKTQQAA